MEKVNTNSVSLKPGGLVKEESKSNRNNKKINYHKLDKSESKEEDFTKKKSLRLKELGKIY